MRPLSTDEPITLALFWPMKPPLPMLSSAVLLAKVRSMAEPERFSELSETPAAGTTVLALRRTFIVEVTLTNVLLLFESYCAAPVWLSAARPMPGT